jgi:chorismate mutase/prephenate dehydratase
MTDLDGLRERIDAIDDQLVRLFRERMEVVDAVAETKTRSRAPVFDPHREQRMLAWGRTQVPEPLGPSVDALLLALTRLSRERQYETLLPLDFLWDLGRRIKAAPPAPPHSARIAVQGSQGAYASQAASALYPAAEIRHAATWDAACLQVVSGDADLAVLPLENTTAGTVNEVYDLLLRHGLFVVRSATSSIRHCLAGLPGARAEDVRTVVSHPQALSQCSGAIRRNGWATRTSTNTAFAAAEVAAAKDPSLAALSSREAAAVHGLVVLSTDVSDTDCNQTRFVVVSSTLSISPDADRVGLVVKTSHSSGSLSGVLSVFADRGLNLAKIQSRPVPDRPWEYRFYVDFQSRPHDPRALLSLYQLEQELPFLRLLGWYAEEVLS